MLLMEEKTPPAGSIDLKGTCYVKVLCESLELTQGKSPVTNNTYTNATEN